MKIESGVTSSLISSNKLSGKEKVNTDENSKMLDEQDKNLRDTVTLSEQAVQLSSRPPTNTPSDNGSGNEPPTTGSETDGNEPP